MAFGTEEEEAPADLRVVAPSLDVETATLKLAEVAPPRCSGSFGEARLRLGVTRGSRSHCRIGCPVQPQSANVGES